MYTAVLLILFYRMKNYLTSLLPYNIPEAIVDNDTISISYRLNGRDEKIVLPYSMDHFVSNEVYQVHIKREDVYLDITHNAFIPYHSAEEYGCRYLTLYNRDTNITTTTEKM